MLTEFGYATALKWTLFLSIANFVIIKIAFVSAGLSKNIHMYIKCIKLIIYLELYTLLSHPI